MGAASGGTMLKAIEAARMRPMSWVKAGLYAIVLLRFISRPSSSWFLTIGHSRIIRIRTWFPSLSSTSYGKKERPLRRFNRDYPGPDSSRLPWASSYSGSGTWAVSSTRSTSHSGSWWSAFADLSGLAEDQDHMVCPSHGVCGLSLSEFRQHQDDPAA